MNEVKEEYCPIYDYILEEEIAFKTRKIPLSKNWNWSMYEHIDKSFTLKNSQYTLGSNDDSTNLRPFKNIILPIANVNYRSEGFDVKDIELYVDNADYYHLSLLARKFHDRWAIKYSIDTAIDESVESYFDYGLSLVKNENNVRPEIIDLKSDLAFCDQSDVLSGTICLKHKYAIDELMDMKGKWDSSKIDECILYSSFTSKDANGQEIKSPSKSVEIYELHGVFPDSWLGAEKLGEDWEDTGKYSRQMHVITYYTDNAENKKGVTLYKGKSKQIFKALKRDKIAKRACGRGGIEELFHSQIWTNYSEIHLQGMLEATSKVITKTTDKKLAQQNKGGFKNNQVVFVDEGKIWEQMVIQPFNKVTFDNYVNSWEQTARVIGSASDPQLGLNPVSGTPLGTTQIVTNQGQGIHEYRRGQIATFWGEIYRDWVIGYMSDELNKGDQWLEELSVEELEQVADRISVNVSRERVKDLILSGKTVTKDAQQIMIGLIKDEFKKGGKKRFMKVMKNEFKSLTLQVKFNIAGKQKNLFDIVNKLNGIFRTVFTNPAVLQAPGMGELFNSILESSGFSPVDFSSLTGIGSPPPQVSGAPAGPAAPPGTPGTPQPSPVSLPNNLATSNQ